jgi:hypothetical protein
MEKRGISDVVTTLIFILLAIVSIAIVWSIVSGILDKGEEVSISSIISNPKIEYAKRDNLQTEIKISNPSNTEIKNFKIILSNGTDSKEEIIESLKPLEIKTITINNTGGFNPSILSLGEANTIEEISEDNSIDKSLVAYWKFDGNAEDSSQYNNNGIINGNPDCNIDGKLNKACSFNGIDQYIDFGNPESLQITKDQTICLWLKPTSFSTRQNPYAKAYAGEGTITQENEQPTISGGTLTYFYGNAGNNTASNNYYKAVNNNKTLTLNTWNHACIVRDLTNIKIMWYHDGILTREATTHIEEAVAGNENVYIGKGYVQNYRGMIDEVMIFNRPLSPEEINQIYLAQNK